MIARGNVLSVHGDIVNVAMPSLRCGSAVRIAVDSQWRAGTVVRAASRQLCVELCESSDGIAAGAVVEEVIARRPALGSAALGRAIPADPSIVAPQVQPAQRTAVASPLWTGVRAIDALLTIGRGARIGIFGSPGAGKSTLLQTILAGTQADAVVLALAGERGREAEHWMSRLDKRSIFVCATSDRTPAERIAVAHTACAHAHALARRGLHVLLVLDSLARVAYALRERASGRGEPVGRGGYPPSVFATLAQLVESAGSFATGSITLIATVLHDGDDRDPVSESARSLLDGHIALSSEIANAGRFPAIDILRSASRTMADVVSVDHLHAARAVRGTLARLEGIADLRALGIEPADPPSRLAMAAEPAIEGLLRQGSGSVRAGEALAMLFQTADTLGEPHGYHV